MKQHTLPGKEVVCGRYWLLCGIFLVLKELGLAGMHIAFFLYYTVACFPSKHLQCFLWMIQI